MKKIMLLFLSVLLGLSFSVVAVSAFVGVPGATDKVTAATPTSRTFLEKGFNATFPKFIDRSNNTVLAYAEGLYYLDLKRLLQSADQFF